MPASFVSRIDRVEPERVLLTLRTQARVRVQGNALGWVRCGRERRWVWGAFDETFRIQGPLARAGARFDRGAANVMIRVWGLGGMSQRALPVAAMYDLQPPRPSKLTRRLRVRPPKAPRLYPLSDLDLPKPEEPNDE